MLKVFRDRQGWYDLGYTDGYTKTPPPRREFFDCDEDSDNYTEGYNDGKVAAAIGYVDGES